MICQNGAQLLLIKLSKQYVALCFLGSIIVLNANVNLLMFYLRLEYIPDFDTINPTLHNRDY